jgi:hypothetical protein
MRRSLLAAAAFLVVGSLASAQGPSAKPNFSGKWTLIADPAAPAMQQGAAQAADYGGLGEASEITMDEKTISIARPSQTVPKSVFNLDGSETRTTIDVGGGTMVDLVLKSKWVEKKLAMTTWATFQGQTFQIDLAFSLDDKGNLVVEHTVPPIGNNPGGSMTVKYKKQ